MSPSLLRSVGEGTIPDVDLKGAATFVQQHFTEGLCFVIGSGLSAAEGIPGMGPLADHLDKCSAELAGDDQVLWQKVAAVLAAKEGLEAALLKHTPTDTLEDWIRAKTCQLLLPWERKVVGEAIRGERSLRLTTLLKSIRLPDAGLPVITPNYDRLIEVACELAGLHCDTTAVGQYAASFDHTRSVMGSCKRVLQIGKSVLLEHYPRAAVLKPHGSFDWYRGKNGPFRSSLDLDCDRIIITPGLNKYRAGYNSPFDKHRELGNNHIRQATRLFVVGYGFNDDHLQNHLVDRIREGIPTLIASHSVSETVLKLADESPACMCLAARPDKKPGVVISTKGKQLSHEGPELWDIGVLATELLS